MSTFLVNPGEPAVIQVEVVSALDGSALEGIQVSYSGTESGSASTNSDGEVAINTYANGETITITASDSAYDDAPAQTVSVISDWISFNTLKFQFSVCCATWRNCYSYCIESNSKYIISFILCY